MDLKTVPGLIRKEPFCKEVLAEFRDLPDGLKITLLENEASGMTCSVPGRRVKVYINQEGDILGLKFLD
ncbi:MAG: hypothetical protein ABFD08_09795 [Syntrophomonas sp.]